MSIPMITSDFSAIETKMMAHLAAEPVPEFALTVSPPVPMTLSAQNLFDTVVTHLLTQDERSVADGPIGYCRYRGPSGRKCAVGALLEDHEYTPEMEGRAVSGINLPARLRPHGSLLRALQVIHDESGPELWPHLLQELASKFGLTYHGLVTAQGLFDQVVDHLRTQGEPALNADGNCVYRAGDGNKCAVGTLMTDGEANPKTEGKGVTSLMSHGLLPHRLIPHSVLLGRLQETHDVVPPPQWERAFNRISEDHGLTYTVPQEVIPA